MGCKAIQYIWGVLLVVLLLATATAAYADGNIIQPIGIVAPVDPAAH